MHCLINQSFFPDLCKDSTGKHEESFIVVMWHILNTLIRTVNSEKKPYKQVSLLVCASLSDGLFTTPLVTIDEILKPYDFSQLKHNYL
jgi:hypothetical protein